MVLEGVRSVRKTSRSHVSRFSRTKGGRCHQAVVGVEQRTTCATFGTRTRGRRALVGRRGQVQQSAEKGRHLGEHGGPAGAGTDQVPTVPRQSSGSVEEYSRNVSF
jgi:hypothetical protein